jgi:hypothetical protein
MPVRIQQAMPFRRFFAKRFSREEGPFGQGEPCDDRLEKPRPREERADLLLPWRHSGFRVDSSRRIPRGDRNALESLLQYFERAPVALSRLEYLDDGRVLYRGNFHPSLRRD